MSSTIPNLPGYRFEMPKKNYAKTQRFAVSNGVMVRDMDPAFRQASREHARNQMTQSRVFDKNAYVEEDAKSHEVKAQTKTGAAWVQHKGQCLGFNAYFEEPVENVKVDGRRIRLVRIFYHLEDGSVHISEPRVDNSGLAQGTLLKRHKVAKGDAEYLSYKDFNIGQPVTIYAREYHVYDTDKFTRTFLTERGIDVSEPLEPPVDTYMDKRRRGQRTDFKKTTNPMKTFMEALAGKGTQRMSPAATRKFFENDGKRLRFYTVMKDGTGDERPYSMSFYLADDTVEIIEIPQQNSGHDRTFSSLLKRQKLPKDYRNAVASVASIGSMQREQDVYTEKDFRIGDVISVYGRELKILGCDSFTRQYYKDTFGMTDADLPDLRAEKKQEERPRMPEPPYNGFGSEEDSLGSFYSLVPRAPRKRFNKELDGKNMRFVARFHNPRYADDADRQFVITYFLVDDTLTIFEREVRNSGFRGGKFLERSKLKNPSTGTGFKAEDFYVGGVVQINAFAFRLISADEHTFKYMETNPGQFTVADVDKVKQKLRENGIGPDAVEQLKAAFAAVDTDGSGKIDKEEFKAMLIQAGWPIEEHEVITLMRKFDSNGDGVVDFVEFSDAVLA